VGDGDRRDEFGAARRAWSEGQRAVGWGGVRGGLGDCGVGKRRNNGGGRVEQNVNAVR